MIAVKTVSRPIPLFHPRIRQSRRIGIHKIPNTHSIGKEGFLTHGIECETPTGPARKGRAIAFLAVNGRDELFHGTPGEEGSHTSDGKDEIHYSGSTVGTSRHHMIFFRGIGLAKGLGEGIDVEVGVIVNDHDVVRNGDAGFISLQSNMQTIYGSLLGTQPTGFFGSGSKEIGAEPVGFKGLGLDITECAKFQDFSSFFRREFCSTGSIGIIEFGDGEKVSYKSVRTKGCLLCLQIIIP